MPSDRKSGGVGDLKYPLVADLKKEAVKEPQPEVHLRADQAVAYRHVAETLADASKAGLHKVGFVSEPEAP